jgi:DNA repair protein SbcD/Mre11
MSVASARVRAMRLLHTSDWHLGRSLHRSDLRAAQETFLDHLVDTVRAERVDAVLVAGDVYDRAVPPVDAVRMCEDALSRLRAAGARVVLISGNHDSARRLGFGSALFDVAGVHLRTRTEQIAVPVMLADQHGDVAVYGIPYLDGCGRPAAEVLAQAVARIPAGQRRVVLSHSWVSGGAVCESERDITMGGVGQVPMSLFDGFSYVALGHLHGRQTLAEHVRYSGSPLPYSFSEASHRKGSWLVEIDGAGTVRAELVPAPVYKRLTVLSDTLPELLASPKYAEFEDDFLAVTLTDPARPEGAMDTLRARFPYILKLEYAPSGGSADVRGYRSRVAGRDDLAIATEFVQHVRNTPATTSELELLRDAFAAVPGPGEDC